MTRKRNTHQAPEWKPVESFVFIASLLILATCMAVAIWAVLL